MSESEVSQTISDTVVAKTVSAASYAGAGTSIVSSLTLTEWGILVGIVTAVLTFALNVWFQWDRRRREVLEHKLRLQDLKDES